MKATKTETVNIHEAKTHLSRLLKRVAAGHEVIIARAGHPIAKLIPIARPGKRPLGMDAGRDFYIAPDFDELPDDLLAAFEADFERK